MFLKKSMVLSLTSLLLFMGSSQVISAQDQTAPEYFDHAEIRMTYFGEKELQVIPSHPAEGNGIEKFSPILIPDFVNALSQILVFGEKIWKIVQDNAPVLNINLGRAISVLPNVNDVATTPMDLENWQLPKSADYHFKGLSNFGNVLAEMTYSVSFSYGGSLNGKGQYLTGVNIVPNKVFVKWGSSFDVKSELKSVINMGTKENPLVAATIELTYRLSTPFSERLMTDVITVVGDGRLVTPALNNAVEFKL